MNPLIITAFTIGAIAGYAICALVKRQQLKNARRWLKEADDHVSHWWREWKAEKGAHSRASDALTTRNQRIERALECVTENSAHVGKKMAAILRGER